MKQQQQHHEQKKQKQQKLQQPAQAKSVPAAPGIAAIPIASIEEPPPPPGLIYGNLEELKPSNADVVRGSKEVEECLVFIE